MGTLVVEIIEPDVREKLRGELPFCKKCGFEMLPTDDWDRKAKPHLKCVGKGCDDRGKVIDAKDWEKRNG
jgi:hypothetical protein